MAGKKWSDSTIGQASTLAPTDQFLIIQASSGQSKRIFASVSATYLKYVAILTQTSGALSPTVTILENTLGFIPVVNRASTGIYTITHAGAFLANKTAVFLGSVLSTAPAVELIGGYAGRSSDDAIVVLTYVMAQNGGAAVVGAAVDNRLPGTSIEIRVYP